MFKSILVPVNLFEIEAAQPAIETAVFFSKNHNSFIHFAYVRSVHLSGFTAYILTNADHEHEAYCKLLMSKVVERLPIIDKSKIKTSIEKGSVQTEILKLAQKQSADLIIVGSQKVSLINSIFGSQALTIAKRASCPVIIARL